MDLPPRIVLASGNAKKLRELTALLDELGVGIVPQASLGVTDADETGATFAANALIKARHAAAATGLPAIADDSGIAVDVLGGRPGVHSARYAGPGADDAANNAKLLAELEGVADRRAHYHCVIAFVRDADDDAPLLCEGRWDGEILEAPRGGGGFGYDPLFRVPTHGVSAAELDPAEKNRISHRGQALARLKAALGTQPPDGGSGTVGAVLRTAMPADTEPPDGGSGTVGAVLRTAMPADTEPPDGGSS